MGGALVDLVLTGTTFVVALSAAGVLIAIGGTGPVIAAILVALFGVLVAALYAPLLMARRGKRNGQTLGKQAVEMRVVRRDGKPIGFGVAVLREFVFKQLFGVAVTGGMFLLVDALWPLFERNGLAVHDIATGTYVVEAGSSPDEE
jgi:uncharacterized RDD family membrane protein YckC